MKNVTNRLSLSKQFLLVSFPILFIGTVVIGRWVGQQVEDSVVHRIGGVTALYVDSFIAPHVQTLRRSDELSARDLEGINADLVNSPLGKKIVSLKIAHPVAAMVGEPQFFGHRMEIKPDGVAHPTGQYLHARAIGVVTANLGVLWRLFADVARCAKWHVELSVRAKADVLPVVVLLRRQIECRRHVHGCHSRVGGNAVKTQHFVYRHHAQRPVLKFDTGRLVELVNHHAAGSRGTGVGDLVNAPNAPRTHIIFAVVAPHHRARTWHARRPNLGFEA